MAVIVGLDHVQLAIPRDGEDEARGFFVGVLGMREVDKPAALSSKGCWFTSGSVNLHVGIDSDFRAARKAHPAFLVDDLVKMRQEMTDAGCSIDPGKPLPGVERFFTADPFGNRIEIIQA